MDDLRQLREDFHDHSVRDEERFQEIHKVLERIDQKLDPIVDVYKATLLSKSFITGVASVIIAIGAIGAGIVWLINHAVDK